MGDDGGAVFEYALLRNLERIASETKVQMKLDHTLEDDDYEPVKCFVMKCVEGMYILTRKSPRSGTVGKSCVPYMDQKEQCKST